MSAVDDINDDFDRIEVESLNRENVRKLVKELVKCRKRRGMSQQDLADDMDVLVDVIRDIESGKGSVVDGLVSYATAEGVVVDYKVTLAEDSQTYEGEESQSPESEEPKFEDASE